MVLYMHNKSRQYFYENSSASGGGPSPTWDLPLDFVPILPPAIALTKTIFLAKKNEKIQTRKCQLLLMAIEGDSGLVRRRGESGLERLRQQRNLGHHRVSRVHQLHV